MRNVLKSLQLDSILAACDPSPGMRILDFGCGVGQLAAALAERGAIVIGADIAPSVTDNRVPPELMSRLRFVQESTPSAFTETFDCVLMSDVINMLPDVTQTLRECLPILASDGRLVIAQGLGRPKLRESYSSGWLSHPGVRPLLPKRVQTWTAYEESLQVSFGNPQRRFLSIEEVRSCIHTVNDLVWTESSAGINQATGAAFEMQQWIRVALGLNPVSTWPHILLQVLATYINEIPSVAWPGARIWTGERRVA